MSGSAAIPEPGQIIKVRQRQYLVEEVIPPPSKGEATRVGMSCVDDDAQGTPLEVLWERELDPEVLTAEAWDKLAHRGFDPPRLFSAYLHTLRWNCLTATNPKLFQSPFRAGIQILPYQLEPLRKALLLPRVNLFIADDVGLGKTIEAGLIVRELLLRKKVRDIVVACPPSMLYQWRDELDARFGLPFEILDREYVTRVRQERGYGVNPWSTHTRFLLSHRLLIDEAYTAPLRDWLGEFRPGALLILDEAHHAAPASGARYAIDSQITRAVRDLAPRFEHRLFLSATPHNGHSNSFSALLELLDPQRFCRGVPVRGKKLLEDIMVRRLKEDIREVSGGFPKRTVVQLDIDGLPPDAPELVLAQLLDAYRQRVESRLAGANKRTQAAAGLLISGLQQRLLSSIEAFARTLAVHKRTAEKHWDKMLRDGNAREAPPPELDLVAEPVGMDDDRAEIAEEELQQEEEAQVEAASEAASRVFTSPDAQTQIAEERRLLQQMAAVAESARHLPDARVRRLVDWIRTHMCPDLPPLDSPEPPRVPPAWNDTRLLLFTEYDDTKRYLRQQLESALRHTERAGERIEVFHGPTPPARREELKRAFNSPPSKHPLRILLATDAAREGLNLQSACHHLFHFDVPWNPSRLEQRNGRIDRKLQPAPEVFCHYFVYRQRPEDRILTALVRKTKTIREELGSLSPVVEARLSETLRRGIARNRVEAQEKEIDAASLDEESRRTVEEELDQARQRQTEVAGQVDHLRGLLDDSKRWINLSQDHFRDAISCSLALHHAEELTPAPSDGAPVPRFSFPALDQRAGGDPTWADTLDTLRAPRGREQSFWQWRKESPVRPVVFQDAGLLDDGVVHLHLEHRVVQRLLGRFTSQGFLHHDLSRACLAQSADPIPRVVLLGRLSLYGPRAARLHEVMVTVTARWSELSVRKGPLSPYAREAETKTLDLLESALLNRNGNGVPGHIQTRLQGAIPTDVGDLLPHLTQRAQEWAEDAQKQLAERGQREAAAMQKLLAEQKARIQGTVARYAEEAIQPKLAQFQEDEKRQLEANCRHWAKRLTSLEQEMEREPERISALYEVQATRIEPVGIAYLWPVTG